MTDHEAQAQKIARCVRGCTTDDQYQELTMAIATALRETYAAGVEDAAKVTAQYQCMNCGKRFLSSEGHSDADCRAGHASWDIIPRDQLTAAIRALIPAKED